MACAASPPSPNIGVPVASVQETTIHGLTVESGEENEGLLPQMSPMKTTDSFPCSAEFNA
jgi:hypothetical protein